MREKKFEMDTNTALRYVYCPLIKENCHAFVCILWVGNIQQGNCLLREGLKALRKPEGGG